jgi:anti-sigma B factor antagonist
MSLQISIRESGDVAILDLRGRWTIDDGDNDLLERRLPELVANGTRKFLLNLANVTQIDSSGVSSIVKTYRSLSGLACDIKLLRPSDHVRGVLNVLHLLEMIPTFEDENLAVASFDQMGDFAKP